ncbi:MAG: hypothetical protein HY303_07635 [Candidatus Wallbacteria bacterium]|nr:hypothetical protein [Candidatus Wallbacteria bacterium]
MTSRDFLRTAALCALAALALLAAPASARAVIDKAAPREEPPPPPPPPVEPAPQEEESPDELSLRGRIRLSNQHVDRTDQRLVVSPVGTVGAATATESGYFGALSANLAGIAESSLNENWMLLVDDRLRLDAYDPQRVDSERYDFLDNRLRVDLGTFAGESTLLDVGGFWDVHRESFDPLFRFESGGAAVSVDRDWANHRNLTASLEYRRTTFDNLAIEDHDQMRAAVGFFRYFPETLDLEVLPVPPEETRTRPGSFEYAGDLELGHSRSKMLEFGAGRLAEASREPESVPTHRRLFHDHVGQREAALGATAAFTRRFGDISAATSFRRATLDMFARRASDDDVVWTADDQLDYTNRDDNDFARFLFDQFDNRASLERMRVGKDALDTSKVALESTYTTDNRPFDSNRVVLDQYSYRHFGKRWALASWMRAYKRFNRQARLDFQDREGFRSKNTFTIEFGADSAVDLSILYERMAVQGLQTELDSTYADLTYEARYRRRLAGSSHLELGYRTERERHQVFFQNNRDEDTVFLDIVADI